MPELPDVEVYVERLAERVVGSTLEKLTIASLFVLRSVEPAPAELEGKRAIGTSRLGKRIVLAFEADLFVVVHLMIAGRLHWFPAGKAVSKRPNLARFEFTTGTLTLTEAGTKRRASLHVVRGAAELAKHDRGGIDPIGASPGEFARALTLENHTLKRSLTDPRFFSGIGNAYSDEILHRAQLSPMQLSRNLDLGAIERLRHATRTVLLEWTERLRATSAGSFPEKVTAFRPEMAVHGRFREPCPVCDSPVQRIVHADNECNYCARCQTGGKLLADRALSRLLKDDWPKSIDELEGR